MRILVTGATGFVGRALVPYLSARNHHVRSVVRRPALMASGRMAASMVSDPIEVASIDGQTDWRRALAGVEAVVHLAGLAHVVDATPGVDATRYDAINTQGTRRLAEMAKQAGIRRFVFLSTSKVYGPQSSATPVREIDTTKPDEPYGQSKLLAEQVLLQCAEKPAPGPTLEHTLEPIILRPPLVYGPGVKANFARLLGWVTRGWPLPLGGLLHPRSFISLSNLCAAIQLALEHPAPSEQIFNVSDGEDLSTAELLRRMGQALDRPVRLIAVPQTWLRAGLTLVGRAADFDRLAGHATIDSSRIRAVLGYVPPQSVDKGLAEVAAWYRGNSSR